MEKLKLTNDYIEGRTKKLSEWVRISNKNIPEPIKDCSFFTGIKSVFGIKKQLSCPLCGGNIISKKELGDIYYSCSICDYENVALSFEGD